MATPTIRYAMSSDGVSIAYFHAGNGPPVVFASNTFGDVHHYNLPHPHTRRMTDALIERGWSVVRSDLRGMGASDRDVLDLSLAAQVGDVEAMVSHAGLSQFALAGVDQGAAVAIAYAARHPERLSHLILLNPFVTGRRWLERSPNARALALFEPMADDDWALTLLMAGTVATTFANPDHARELAAGFQASTSPATWKSNFEAIKAMDLTACLPLIRTPTLVIHDTGFPFGSFQSCQEVASGINDATFLVIRGDGEAEITVVADFLRPAPAWEGPRGPRVQGHPVSAASLTRRQRDVLALLAGGATNREIAERLSLSVRTVERHLADIYGKIGVRHRAEAVAATLTGRLGSELGLD